MWSAGFAGDLFWEGGGSGDVVGTAGIVGGKVGAAEHPFWFGCRFGWCHYPPDSELVSQEICSGRVEVQVMSSWAQQEW